MIINNLKDHIKNNNIDEAINLIEKIGENKVGEAVPYLIELLEGTNNPLIRNSVALALADIGRPEAVEPLIRALKNPNTKGFRGNLLAALEPFDYSSHVDLLFEFLIEGNFEVSRKSFLLLEQIAKDLSMERKKKFIDNLSDEIDDLEDKIDLLSEAIEIFNADL